MLRRIFTKVFGRRTMIINNQYANIDNFDAVKILMAQPIIECNRRRESLNIHDFEFKVFSQWGDDGIIQYLLMNIDFPHKTFVEFGVQDYSESNTRFLMMNNNWDGLIMDGSSEYIDFIRKQEYFWRHNLQAICAFVNAENINELLLSSGFNSNVGIYHIDIDGNDYWIWKATDVIKPIIVIAEYQSLFGCERTITTPYDPLFVRTKAHFSNLFYGSSLASLCDLADEKGYFFVGCNSAGNNAYFVRKDKIGKLRPLQACEGYVLSKFREARDESGNLLYLSGSRRLELIRGLQVYNTRSNKLEVI